jgi:hypothetical protein
MSFSGADNTAPNSAAQPPPQPPDPNSVPIIQVARGHGMWWSVPAEMSKQLYESYANNEDAVYTWDWGDTRQGAWKPDDEETSISRYIVDFVSCEQRNIDTDRKRSIRLVWVRPQDVNPTWTGEIVSRLTYVGR